MKITRPAAFHARIVLRWICGHSGGAREPPHIEQNRRYLRPKGHPRPEHHLRHQLTMTEMNVMKSKVCHPNVWIYILHFQTLNFSIIMDMPRIAIAIMILFQMCWVHYLLPGSTADIDFENDDSLLSVSDGEDDHWLKGTGFLSIISM